MFWYGVIFVVWLVWYVLLVSRERKVIQEKFKKRDRERRLSRLERLEHEVLQPRSREAWGHSKNCGICGSTHLNRNDAVKAITQKGSQQRLGRGISREVEDDGYIFS